MGFYIRKSVRVGPLRFNLSKSGIGVSAGIPGFRVGTGPRGNYVHAGRGGIYYRATLPSAPRAQQQIINRSSPPVHSAYDSTVGPQIPIESGSVLGMRDESANGLLAELNSKHSRWRFGALGVLAVIFSVAYLWNSLIPISQAAIAILGTVAVILLLAFDEWRKSTVIMYDFDDDGANAFQGLVSAVNSVGGAQKLWHVESKADVLDRKYHAGAASEISRKSISVRTGRPPFVKSNIDVPFVKLGKQTLYFYPDRLLVFEPNAVGAVAYSELRVERSVTTFIESQSAPSDSRVVSRTWRYVNRNGGPDKRFKQNPEYPVCEYESIHLGSASGLNELLHASRVGSAEALIRYLTLEHWAPPSPPDSRRHGTRAW
jgi:hypothetical protein